MDSLTDEEALAEAIADVAFDVLHRIGDAPDARYTICKRFVERARDIVKDRACSSG